MVIGQELHQGTALEMVRATVRETVPEIASGMVPEMVREMVGEMVGEIAREKLLAAAQATLLERMVDAEAAVGAGDLVVRPAHKQRVHRLKFA